MLPQGICGYSATGLNPGEQKGDAVLPPRQMALCWGPGQPANGGMAEQELQDEQG